MSRSARKSIQRRQFRLLLEHLEIRQLLAVSILTGNQSIKQEGDFTGSSSSVGPDGYKDIKIEVSGLAQKQVKSAMVTGVRSGGNAVWQYGENKPGYGYAEFLRVTSTGDSNWPKSIDDESQGTAKIYINPPGGTNAITSIKVKIYYTDGSEEPEVSMTDLPSDLHSLNLESRTSLTNVPTLRQNAAEFQTNQFYGTETSSVKKGDIQIKLNSLPDGKLFSNIQEMYLDDGSGAAYGEALNGTLSYGGAVWSSTYGRGAYRLSYSNQTSYMDIYAQPIRNELGATMTLVVKFTDNSSFYTQFPGKTVDVTFAGRTNGFSEIQNEKSY